MFVKYEFSGKHPPEQRNWTFKQEMLPEPGSWWIIVCETLTSDGWLTLNGPDGRLRFSQTNFNKVMDELEAANNHLARAGDRRMVYQDIVGDMTYSH